MHRIVWVFILALVVGLVPAMADTWAFQFKGDNSFATGILTGTPNGGATETAIAGTGVYTGKDLGVSCLDGERFPGDRKSVV